MLLQKRHTASIIFSQLVIMASLCCVLFGQGIHLHDLAVHFGDHLDIHAHVHAHESHDEPLQNTPQDEDHHQHKVSTASDIVGTLVPSNKIKPDIQRQVVVGSEIGYNFIDYKISECPTKFDLPPPEFTASQYHLSSFSHRGPPVA